MFIIWHIFNPGRPRTIRIRANEDAIIGATEWEPWTRSPYVACQLYCPFLENSKYFVTISCIHITIQCAHICFQTNFLYGKNKKKTWLNFATTTHCWWYFLHQMLWTYEAYFMLQGLLNIHTSHLWTRNKPHTDYEHGYEICFCVSSGITLPVNFVGFVQADCSKISHISVKSSTGGC